MKRLDKELNIEEVLSWLICHPERSWDKCPSCPEYFKCKKFIEWVEKNKEKIKEKIKKGGLK